MPSVSWVIVAWLAVLGAVLGSFLNVVVLRLPRGESLIEPPSHCPKCGHPIRWYDNVPMLSWVLLRGRCRDCRAAISPRYPLVEAACCASFLILAILVCGMEGINLPARQASATDRIVLTTGWSGRELYAIFLFHQLLWCMLLVAGLIESDGQRAGWRVYGPALGIAALAATALPVLHPVPAWKGLDGWHAGIINGALGLAAGAALGWLLSRVEPAARRNGVGLGLACIGLVLGWQAALGLAALTVLWQLLSVLMSRYFASMRNLPTSLVLPMLTLAWLTFWAPLVSWFPCFGQPVLP